VVFSITSILDYNRCFVSAKSVIGQIKENINMSPTLCLFLLLSLVIPVWFNFLLNVISGVVAKLNPTATPIQLSMEEAVSKVISTILLWFKHL
jgi:hypothetical protein